MQSGGYNSSPKGRKERKVSFLFRRSDTPHHCAGINSVLLSQSGQQLWTASRDSLVKRYVYHTPVLCLCPRARPARRSHTQPLPPGCQAS